MEYKSHSVIFFIFIRSFFLFSFGHISRFHSVGFSIRPRELLGEMALQEVEHLTVELMAVEVLVIDIGAAAVEDAEGAAEVPQGPAEMEFTEDVELIAEPGKGDVVGRAVVGAELADEEGLTAGIEHGAP